MLADCWRSVFLLHGLECAMVISCLFQGRTNSDYFRKNVAILLLLHVTYFVLWDYLGYSKSLWCWTCFKHDSPKLVNATSTFRHCIDLPYCEGHFERCPSHVLLWAVYNRCTIETRCRAITLLPCCGIFTLYNFDFVHVECPHSSLVSACVGYLTERCLM